MQAHAIIVAAGRAERFGGDMPKQFVMMNDRPMLAWTIDRFIRAASIGEITLVVPEDFRRWVADEIVSRYAIDSVVAIVAGGRTRQESVLNGLEQLPTSTDLVAIHDGARPLVAPNDIDRVVEVALRHRAAILSAPVTETIKRVADGRIVETIDRSTLAAAQTPQAFEYELILEAHRGAPLDAPATDDALLVEARGVDVYAVMATSPNPKVTTASDLSFVATALKESADVPPANRPRV